MSSIEKIILSLEVLKSKEEKIDKDFDKINEYETLRGYFVNYLRSNNITRLKSDYDMKEMDIDDCCLDNLFRATVNLETKRAFASGKEYYQRAYLYSHRSQYE